MGKVSDAYEAKYGVVARAILRSWFGGNPDAIIEAEEACVGEACIDLDSFLSGGAAAKTLTPEDCAESAYWAIIRAIKDAFFGKMPREQAVSIVGALSAFPSASVTFCEGLTYNAATFADAWNAANPDAPEIYFGDDADLP